MQKNLKRILSVCGAVCLIVAVGSWRHVRSDAVEEYYAPISAAGGNALLGQLHDLITTTHAKYSTYADCRDLAPVTDPSPNGEGVVEFYTHETITTYIGSSNKVGTWNREHVWCKSLSNGLWKKISNNEAGGGADLHHIRPAEMSMNSTRGDDKYGVVKNGSAIYSKSTDGTPSKLGGHHAGGVFEPIDEVKGDVARIVMYVYTHYNTYENVYGTTNGSGTSSYFGTLDFTHVISEASEGEAISLLLEWNKSDPVDAIERTRNEVVFGIQGNRNPFIDHPEYADAIWGEPQGGDMGGEEVDHAKLRAFRTAVEEIPSKGLGAQLATLKKAISACQTLTAAERALAKEDIARLQDKINEYNAKVRGYNTEAERAEMSALGV